MINKVTEEAIKKQFGKKLRLRASGIYIENDKILMIKHHSLGKENYLWAPPGGGVEYAESIENTLKREFLEETGLVIEVKEFAFINEFLAPPLHAVELFFWVEKINGKLKKGKDPEMPENDQIITEITFLSLEELNQEKKLAVHSCFRELKSFNDLQKKEKYFHYSE